METKIDGREGWVEVTRAGVHVLAKGDDSLRERLESALDQAGDEPAVDVITDELTTGGVRRTPDFAIVDDDAGRALVRGSASVQLTDAAGETAEIVAPSRGPWADEDLDAGLQAAVLSTGEPEPAPSGPQFTDDGWAIPSVFAGGAGASGVDGAPEPAVLDEPAPARDGADDELPAYDFLFGGEDQQRSEPQPASETPIDSGPVAAAGGYQPPENPVNATLAPVGDEEPEEPATAGADHGAGPAVAAGAAGAAGAGVAGAAGGAAIADGPGDGDEPAQVGEQVAASPQFVDGHLVSSRVAGREDAGSGADSGADPITGSGPHASAAAPAAASAAAVDSHPDAGRGGEPADDPGLFTQIIEGDPAVPGNTEPTGVDDTGELPAGPVVLAVRCAQGHHSAPHATRCRVCGEELPTQQPEPTVRPALGLLRLSTGDVVSLDRGVLIGRAPTAPQGADAEGAPHLVRVASPDNEISRNHVEVLLDGWHVLVRDLGSTNGTTVALPGSSPVRVRPDDQQTIEPGTTVTLADQVSMVFEITG